MFKDIDDQNRNHGLELFANFVNSLPEETKRKDLTWQSIPWSFAVTQLNPRLKRLGINYTPEEALVSLTRATDFEQELDQFAKAQLDLNLHGLTFFKSELWKPGDAYGTAFLGSLRESSLTPIEYRIRMRRVIIRVNQIRYINDQVSIPTPLVYFRY